NLRLACQDGAIPTPETTERPGKTVTVELNGCAKAVSERRRGTLRTFVGFYPALAGRAARRGGRRAGAKDEEDSVAQADGPKADVGALLGAADQGGIVAGASDVGGHRGDAARIGLPRASVDLRLELAPGSGPGGCQGTRQV